MSNIIRFNPNPITDYLQEHWQAIRDEYVAYRKSRWGIDNCLEPNPHDEVTKPQVTTLHEKIPLYTGTIHALPLYLEDAAVSLADRKKMPFWPLNSGAFISEQNIDAIPTLKHWMTHIAKPVSVTFYLNQPMSKINHHYGPETNNNNFRIHMGLSPQDNNVQFDLENERYIWSEGDIMAFDDSAVYHGVIHKGTHPRLVLAIDYPKEPLLRYAYNYKPRKWIAKQDRVPPVINNWD